MMPKLPILDRKYMASLQRRVKSGAEDVIKSYQGSNEFTLEDKGIIRRTHLEFDALPELSMGDGEKGPSSDFENACRIFNFLPDLNPTEAADKRLWAYLTHGPFFEYCCWRWPFPSEPEKAVSHILDHWFFGRGHLRRNAISRLWWAASFTYAPWDRDSALKHFEKEDPFFYTRVLLSKQDVYQGINERMYGSNRAVRICALDTIDRHRGRDLSDTALATKFTQSLNFVAKHTDLAGLEINALKDLCDRIAGQLTSAV